MTIYVDQPQKWPGKKGEWCHMITDGAIDDLHIMALAIGLKPAWYQADSFPHYDLTPSKREKAVRLGAVECDRQRFVEIIRSLR